MPKSKCRFELKTQQGVSPSQAVDSRQPARANDGSEDQGISPPPRRISDRLIVPQVPHIFASLPLMLNGLTEITQILAFVNGLSRA